MHKSSWTFIESQEDLDSLNTKYYWGDGASTVEFFGCLKNEEYFPLDISRSGWEVPNLHVLVQLLERRKDDPAYIEFVFIACDKFDDAFLSQPNFNGFVDSLKRAELANYSLRCARIIYRLLDGVEFVNLEQSTYFQNSDSVISADEF